MKWMIASDIHGCGPCCRQLVRRYENEKADRLLLLGDLLYHGPRNGIPEGYDPGEVAGMLNGIKEDLLCVRGNCDSEVDQAVLNFPVLADYALLDPGDGLVFATHGHRFHADALPPLKEGDVLLYGHTHIPECRTVSGIVCMNPGSVSIPKGGSARGYMTYEDGLFLWKTMEGTEYKHFFRRA